MNDRSKQADIVFATFGHIGKIVRELERCSNGSLTAEQRAGIIASACRGLKVCLAGVAEFGYGPPVEMAWIHLLEPGLNRRGFLEHVLGRRFSH
jgi:hypothetical protein